MRFKVISIVLPRKIQVEVVPEATMPLAHAPKEILRRRVRKKDITDLGAARNMFGPTKRDFLRFVPNVAYGNRVFGSSSK